MKEENKKKSSYWDRMAYALLIGIPLLLLGRYMGEKMAIHNHKGAAIENSNPWSSTKVNALKQAIGANFDSLMDMDSTEKKMLCDCSIQKLKFYAPHGLDSLSTDSSKALIFKATSACSSVITVSHFKTWTPEYIKKMKNELVLNPELAKYSDNQRSNFCDCYLLEIRNNYPNGFKGGLPSEEQKKFVKRCAKYLLK
jgi:hypothetical protein